RRHATIAEELGGRILSLDAQAALAAGAIAAAMEAEGRTPDLPRRADRRHHAGAGCRARHTQREALRGCLPDRQSLGGRLMSDDGSPPTKPGSAVDDRVEGA